MYLLRLQIKIMPKRYFHFARLIDGLDEDVPYIGVAFRLIVPLIAGYGTAIALILLKLPGLPYAAGSAVGFLSAFWLIWPDLYNPALISPIYYHKRSKLYLIYCFVTLSFTVMGYFGGLLAPLTLRLVEPLAVVQYLDPKAIFNNLLSTLFYNLIAWLLLSKVLLSQLRRVRTASTTSDHNGTAKRDADTR